MFQRILLATDGSAAAVAAADYAVQMARCGGGRVFVVHAYPHIPRYLGEPQITDLMTQHVRAGEQVVSPVVEQLREAGLEATSEVLEGPPAEAILRVAQVRECDLIIVGNRGQGELSSALLGSVSHKVIANARAPVLVIRASE